MSVGASVKKYIYTARLVPIGKPVRIPFVDGSPSELLTFDDKSFELERTSKTKYEVWVNHDRDLRIGNVAMLYTSREGWWECDFGLDRDAPDDIEFEVGQPVSVGIQQLKIGSCGTFLREVSIVRHGAVKGAQITRRFEIKPEPVKPAVPTSSPAASSGSTSDRGSPPAKIHYAPVVTRTNRDLDESDELRRRIDWLERTGRSPDFELVLTNLQDELGGRSLEREYARALARGGVVGVP